MPDPNNYQVGMPGSPGQKITAALQKAAQGPWGRLLKTIPTGTPPEDVDPYQAAAKTLGNTAQSAAGQAFMKNNPFNR